MCGDLGMNVDALYVAVGQNIRKAREKRGLTQAELASAVSLTRTSITNVERGRQRLLLHTLCDIAAALAVTPSDLIPESMHYIEPGELEQEIPQDLSVDEREWIRSVVTPQQNRG